MINQATHLVKSKAAVIHRRVVTNLFTASACPYEMSWKKAFGDKVFVWKFSIGWLFTIVSLFFFPHFFAAIQQRQGVVLQDYLLSIIPSADVSGLIFSVIYFSVVIAIRRSLKSPQLFLTFLWAYLFLNMMRMLTIYMVPLEPPSGLVILTDPVMVPFYGKTFITKDLFFSGHTATVFLSFLIVQKRWEKMLMMIATCTVGVLLLVQHIHYTIDVVMAPVFTFFIFVLARKVTDYSSE